MKKLSLVLAIDNTTNITVNYQFINEIYGCDDVEIKLHSNNTSLLLYYDSIDDGLSSLQVLLVKAINNACYLDASINQGVGRMWNDHLQERDENIKKIWMNEHDQWIGEQHLVWSSKKIRHLDV